MNILNNILNYLESSGKSQKDLADQLKISKNCVTEWKSGRSRSYMKYVPQIAEFLGVTVDMLYASPDSPSSVNIHNSGIIGNHNSNCCNTAALPLGEIEQELITLCGKMTMQQKKRPPNESV